MALGLLIVFLHLGKENTHTHILSHNHVGC
jgi:hypothetical protein